MQGRLIDKVINTFDTIGGGNIQWLIKIETNMERILSSQMRYETHRRLK